MKVKLEVFSGIVEIQITDISIQGCFLPPPAPHRVCPLVTLGMGCHPDRLCLPSERPLPPNPSFLFLLLSPPVFFLLSNCLVFFSALSDRHHRSLGRGWEGEEEVGETMEEVTEARERSIWSLAAVRHLTFCPPCPYHRKDKK